MSEAKVHPVFVWKLTMNETRLIYRALRGVPPSPLEAAEIKVLCNRLQIQSSADLTSMAQSIAIHATKAAQSNDEDYKRLAALREEAVSEALKDGATTEEN